MQVTGELILSGGILVLFIYREIVNYREIKFYRAWVNKFVENNSGRSIDNRTLEAVRPFTDEEEAALERNRNGNINV